MASQATKCLTHYLIMMSFITSLCHIYYVFLITVVAGTSGVPGGQTREESQNDGRQETDCSPRYSIHGVRRSVHFSM